MKDTLINENLAQKEDSADREKNVQSPEATADRKKKVHSSKATADTLAGLALLGKGLKLLVDERRGRF